MWKIAIAIAIIDFDENRSRSEEFRRGGGKALIEEEGENEEDEKVYVWKTILDEGKIEKFCDAILVNWAIAQEKNHKNHCLPFLGPSFWEVWEWLRFKVVAFWGCPNLGELKFWGVKFWGRQIWGIEV